MNIFCIISSLKNVKIRYIFSIIISRLIYIYIYKLMYTYVYIYVCSEYLTMLYKHVS